MTEIPLHFRQVLAELELLSHGSVAAVNPGGGGGKPWWQEGSNAVMPPGEAWPPHITFRTAYVAADDHVKRAEVVLDAEQVLARRRGHGLDRSRVVEETTEQQDARMIQEGRGHPAERVALAFRCTPTRVRRVRLAAGVRADDGESIDSDAEGVGRAKHARALKASGLNQREIADRMGISQPTVHRLLKTQRREAA